MNELLSLVGELKEEVERLRANRECEQEMNWWSESLMCQREGCQGDNAMISGGSPALSQSDRADRARGLDVRPGLKSQVHPLPAYPTSSGPAKQQV